MLWTDSPRKKFTKSAKDLCFIIYSEVNRSTSNLINNNEDLKKVGRKEERKIRKELVPLLINSSFDSYTVVVTVNTHRVTT